GAWEIEIQSDDGGIMEGLIDDGGKKSISFNTGMVLHGWLDLHEEEPTEGRWLAAARRAGDFLVMAQDDDGAWRGEYSYNGIPHTNKSRVAWALIRLALATGDEHYRAAGLRYIHWVLGQHQDNAW